MFTHTLFCRSRLSLTLVTLSLILLVLQHTIFSTYVVICMFYLNLILTMLSIGQHALAVAALLSVGAVILIFILIVRNSNPISADSSSAYASSSLEASVSRLTIELQVTMILCVMLSALTLVHGSTFQTEIDCNCFWTSSVMLFECRIFDRSWYCVLSDCFDS
jgi:hypothetical protein